jgi:hypothetical protein
MPAWFKVLAGAYLALLANSVFPTVLLASPWWNTAVFAGIQIIPFMLFAYVLMAWAGRRRVSWALGLLPFVFVAVLSGVVSVFALVFPPAIDRVQTIDLGLTTIAAYQTNGGATTSFGMIVRQEMRVVPGVLLIRVLAHEYPAERVLIERTSDRTIRLTFPAYGDRRPQPVVIQKRLLLL